MKLHLARPFSDRPDWEKQRARRGGCRTTMAGRRCYRDANDKRALFLISTLKGWKHINDDVHSLRIRSSSLNGRVYIYCPTIYNTQETHPNTYQNTSNTNTTTPLISLRAYIFPSSRSDIACIQSQLQHIYSVV